MTSDMNAHEHPTPRPGLSLGVLTQGNNAGLSAMIFGIAGVVFSLIPIVGIIAWPMVIIGLLLGYHGVRKAQAGEATNNGQALAGLILSAIGFLVCFGWLVAFMVSIATNGMPFISDY